VNAKKKAKVRLSNRSASTIEAEEAFSGSTIEQVGKSPVRPSKQGTTPKIILQAA